ncbi:hypothetical protein [Sphingobium sp. YR768]|uniref:hypothetical protein n=1 Tax=Sphingobium sp. YR768 TaxID=1884365 RepID=UPI0008B02509|nr:hypothetical protein [Sphingobium sp. YR768]SER09403.1 hypothetical protein SAMN05518866_1054 [Sphingobium sp. YR768]
MSLKTSLIITGDSATAKAAVDALTQSVEQLGTRTKDTAPAAAQMETAVGSVASTAATATGAIGELDGALDSVAASAGAVADRAAAADGSIGQIGNSARAAANDAGLLDNVLGNIGGAIKDTVAKAAGLDGALSNVGGSSEEASEFAGALEEQLGGLADSALESSAAQGAITKASGAAATAMSAFGVSAGAVEGILTGGLALVLPLVIGFLSGFASEALEGADAMAEEEDAAASLTEQIDALNEALKRETQTQYTSRVESLKNAEAKRLLAIRTIEATKAALNLSIAEQKRTPGWSVAGPGQAIQQAASMQANANVRDLQAQLADAEAALVSANKLVAGNRKYFVDRGIEATTDPRARVGLNYDQRLARLDSRRDQMSEQDYARAKVKLDKDRAAALDAVSEAERKASASGKTLAGTRASATAADRAAAEATKKLQADLEGVIGRYDPARKAAKDYADELERIAALAKAGKISGEDVANYRAQASAAYLSKALPLGDIKDMAAQEQAAIDASGAIDQIVQSIEDETTALATLDPVQRAMLGYRKELLALSPEERAAAEGRIANALKERDATEAMRQATEDAQRAKEQLARAAGDAFSAIIEGGQKATDVIGGLAKTISAAAMEGALFGTGPMAALFKSGGTAGSGGSKGGFAEGYGQFFGDLKGDFRSIFSDIFGDGGVFSKSLGKTLGGLAAGAQTGATAGSLATSLLGIKGSSTGGAIGGAIGSAIAGPIGSIVGGTLGSVVGGLLKKTKTGSANITSVDGDATLSGNSSAYKQAASGAASSVQDGLSELAEMLGGAIGSFNVTIGQRHGDWRVRSGTGSLKVAKGAKEFDDDQAGAIAYAIQLAVSQGAVTGLSAAVEKALKSSDDLEDALAEALKVQEVETLLGGITAEMTSQFKTFEAQAKERLRIATEYGFDIVAIEKKNAEDRAALVDEILSSRVGSLQDMLDDLSYGDLFEGSAADQRTALLAEIAKARSAAEAGEDGAADTLATLSRQLIELSRNAYGTAGTEYTNDRDSAIADAQAVIKAESDRIAAAQDAAGVTNAKLETANQIANEQADQLVQISSTLDSLLSAVSSSYSGTILTNTDLVARSA